MAFAALTAEPPKSRVILGDPDYGPRGVPARRKSSYPAETILERVLNGVAYKEVAAEFGCDVSTVSRLARNAGIRQYGVKESA